MTFRRFVRTGNKGTTGNRKLPLHSTTCRIHPYREGQMEHEIAIIDGIEAPIYREVLQAERAELYATPDRSTRVREHYLTGLFSAGRPGIIATSE